VPDAYDAAVPAADNCAALPAQARALVMELPEPAVYAKMTTKERYDTARAFLRQALGKEDPRAVTFSINVEAAVRFAYGVMGEPSEMVPTVLIGDLLKKNWRDIESALDRRDERLIGRLSLRSQA
jgi:hypothetical protein